MNLLSRYAKGELMLDFKRKDPGGFSMIELLVVVAVMAVLAAVALPSFLTWVASVGYRDVAFGISAKSKLARSTAVTRNLETRVEFDVDAKRYRVTQGNSPSGSTTWITIVSPWVTIHPEISWRTGTASGADCTGTADLNVIFNPNGSSDGGVICVQDTALAEQYWVTISAASGRVRID